ncbi:MAG: tail fiber protein [Chlorobiaceae bacterium]|nr:tail fiber protein [Chlorobiaceae bacterium]
MANFNIKTALTGGNVECVDRNTPGMKISGSVCVALVSGFMSCYMFDGASLATADGINVIIPFGQSAGTAGRWILQKPSGTPGDMKPWPAPTPPAGWLIRDGSAISRTAYSALFAVLGTRYGAGDGSSTFNLPDDRGLGVTGYKPGDSAFGNFGVAVGSKDAVVVYHGHGVYDPGHDHEERVCNIPGAVGGNFAAGTNADYGAHTGTYRTYGSTTGIGIYQTGETGVDKNIQPTRPYLPIIKY